MNEQRKFPRLEKTLPIKLFDNQFDLLTETKNISANGAYCRVNKPLKIMTKLNMVLLIPVKKSQQKTIKKINCSGVVVRREPATDSRKYAYNVGIYFSDLKDRDRKALRLYIDSALKN